MREFIKPLTHEKRTQRVSDLKDKKVLSGRLNMFTVIPIPFALSEILGEIVEKENFFQGKMKRSLLFL